MHLCKKAEMFPAFNINSTHQPHQDITTLLMIATNYFLLTDPKPLHLPQQRGWEELCTLLYKKKPSVDTITHHIKCKLLNS